MSLIERLFGRKRDEVPGSPAKVVKAAEQLMRTFSDLDVARADYIKDVSSITSQTRVEEAIRRKTNLENFRIRAGITER